MGYCQNFGLLVKQVDPFAAKVSPTFIGGTNGVTSWFGTCTGFVLVILLIMYAQTKLYILSNSSSTTVAEPTLQNYFNDSYILDSEDGFQIAFALAGYDSSTDKDMSSQYGQVKLFQRVWGERDEETGEPIPTRLDEVETEPCQESFFPFSNVQESTKAHRFYPLEERSVVDVKRSMHLLRCPKANVEVRGDYNSKSGSTLIVAFERCKGGSTAGCKDD